MDKAQVEVLTTEAVEEASEAASSAETVGLQAAI